MLVHILEIALGVLAILVIIAALYTRIRLTIGLSVLYLIALGVLIALSTGCAFGRFNENGAWIVGSGKIVDGERSVECLQLPRLGQK